MNDETTGTTPEADEPRYGRRSQDEPGYQPASNSSSQPTGSIPATPGYQAPGSQAGYQGPVSQGAYQGQGGQPGQPAGYQGQPAGYQGQPGGYPGQPGGYRPQELPGRGLPITLIVLGAIIMLVGAPIVFTISTAVSAVSQFAGDNDFAAGVSLPAEVQVTDSGVFAAALTGASPDTTCVLAGSDGNVTLEHETSQGVLSVSTESAPAGTYELQCDNADGASAMILDDELIGNVVSGLGTGFIASLITFAIGLALLIWGIVKLVKVNRRRREIQFSTFGY